MINRRISQVKIGLAQIDCSVGDLPANCNRIAGYASRAKAEGCAVVIFPEMADTGYVPSVISRCAAPWPGPALNAVTAAARDNGITIICGLSERTPENIYNSVVLIDSSGAVREKYRKTHLFSAAPVHEERVFTPGNDFVVAELEGVTWGFSICYDLRFPEIYRVLTLSGADVLLNCAAWPASRPEHWDYLSRARAIENQAFFVGVNRVGTDEGLKMLGRSRIVTPRGEILCEAGEGSEELLTAEIDCRMIDDFRNDLPVLSSRRTDLYK